MIRKSMHLIGVCSLVILLSARFDPDPTHPPFQEVTKFQKHACGAIFTDDFQSEKLDGKKWRVLSGIPKISQGALVLSDARIATMAFNKADLVAVCEAELGEAQDFAIRLNGEQPGPPYWMGVRIDKSGRASVEYFTEPGTEGAETEPVADPESVNLGIPRDGKYTVKIERVADTGEVHCFALGASGWREIGASHVVPMMASSLTLEANGGSIRFDNCRIYPRPQVKFVYFRVRSLDKSKRTPHREVVLELYEKDGKTLAGKARGYHGATLVPLIYGQWNRGAYPVPAVVKVYCYDKSVGAPQTIELNGLNGLYPNDEWDIEIR